jgi:ribosomal protein S18 acetylase RimI-like enzyme
MLLEYVPAMWPRMPLVARPGLHEPRLLRHSLKMTTLRLATKSDGPELLDLVESAYRGEPSRAGWTTEADLLGGQRADAQMIEDIIAHPDQALLMLEAEGGLVGCVVCENRTAYGYIGMVSVRPGLQGAGTGRQLLAHAEAWLAFQWQLARARMTVISQRTELIAWYERRGYRLTGETAAFPYGDARFGLPKRDDLFFVVLEKKLI